MDEQTRDELFEQVGLAAQANQSAQQAAATQYYLEEQDKGLAETQLNVEEILANIYHWLRQDIKSEKNKKIVWEAITDAKQRTLSDIGVDKIMGKLHFYINRNTLLTNLDEKQIARVMLRFVKEMNSLLFLKYQAIFKQLTFEECKEILEERIEGRKKIRKYALELSGKTVDDKEVKKEVVLEMETKIEKEMEKIREEKRKEQLREYGSIMAELEHIVYFCLNRAFRGEERGSIRRHTNISELVGKMPMQEKQRGGIFKWGRD